MKRPLLITLGITLLLIVLGVWIYLMLFGSPDSTQDVFSDLGFDIVAQPTTPVPANQIPLTNNTDGVVEASDSALQQLTTREVAGFVILEDGNATKVRFAEVGTGHIYDVMLTTRSETRVSAKTIPQVITATFSKDGSQVALTQLSGAHSQTFVGTLAASSTDSTLEGTYVPEDARDLYFTPQALLYTLSDSDSTEGYRFTGDILNQTEVFSIPFSSITMAWQGSGPHYFYNRPAAALSGTLFELNGTTYTPTTPTALGRAAMVTTDYFALTYTENNQLLAESYSRDTNQHHQLAIATIPEKCTPDEIDTTVVWCAAPVENLPSTWLEDWYQGEIVSDDILWEVQLNNGEAILEANFEALAGRPLDAIDVASDSVTNNLLFINKTDRTLWTYDLLAQ